MGQRSEIVYLAETDETEMLTVKEDENKAVKWCIFEAAVELPTEHWMVERVYKKLIERSK